MGYGMGYGLGFQLGFQLGRKRGEGGWMIVLAGVGLRSNGLWLTDYVAAGEAVGDVAQLAFPAETHKN